MIAPYGHNSISIAPAVTSVRSLTTELVWESAISSRTRRLDFRTFLLMRLFVIFRFEARMSVQELAYHVLSWPFRSYGDAPGFPISSVPVYGG